MCWDIRPYKKWQSQKLVKKVPRWIYYVQLQLSNKNFHRQEAFITAASHSSGKNWKIQKTRTKLGKVLWTGTGLQFWKHYVGQIIGFTVFYFHNRAKNFVIKNQRETRLHWNWYWAELDMIHSTEHAVRIYPEKEIKQGSGTQKIEKPLKTLKQIVNLKVHSVKSSQLRSRSHHQLSLRIAILSQNILITDWIQQTTRPASTGIFLAGIQMFWATFAHS